MLADAPPATNTESVYRMGQAFLNKMLLDRLHAVEEWKDRSPQATDSNVFETGLAEFTLSAQLVAYLYRAAVTPQLLRDESLWAPGGRYFRSWFRRHLRACDILHEAAQHYTRAGDPLASYAAFQASHEELKQLYQHFKENWPSAPREQRAWARARARYKQGRYVDFDDLPPSLSDRAGQEGTR